MTVGRTIKLNLSKALIQHKMLSQNFANMLIANEPLLQEFISNENAMKMSLKNKGVKMFH